MEGRMDERPLSEQARQADSASNALPRKLGQWGRLYLQTLARNDPEQEKQLRNQGQLQAVAQSVDELAEAEFTQTLSALIEQNAKQKPAKDYATNLARVERCRRQAEELVQASVLVP